MKTSWCCVIALALFAGACASSQRHTPPPAESFIDPANLPALAVETAVKKFTVDFNPTTREVVIHFPVQDTIEPVRIGAFVSWYDGEEWHPVEEYENRMTYFLPTVRGEGEATAKLTLPDQGENWGVYIFAVRGELQDRFYKYGADSWIPTVASPYQHLLSNGIPTYHLYFRSDGVWGTFNQVSP